MNNDGDLGGGYKEADTTLKRAISARGSDLEGSLRCAAKPVWKTTNNKHS